MAWLKLDDQIFLNRKVAQCDTSAKMLYIVGLSYCANQLTDGFIPEATLPLLAGMAGLDWQIAKQSASKLLDVCLWSATQNGWQIPDYLEYNPSREQVLHNQAVRSEAGKAGGRAKASKLPGKTLANDKQNSSKSLPPSPSPSSSSSGSPTIADVHRLFTERFFETFGHQPPMQAPDDGSLTALVAGGITLQQIDHAIASSLEGFKPTNSNPYPKTWRYCLPAMQRAMEPPRPRNGTDPAKKPATYTLPGVEEKSLRYQEMGDELVAEGITPENDTFFYVKLEQRLEEKYGNPAAR